MINYSKQTLTRWQRDFKLPFPTLEEPYLSYYVELYDDLFQTKQKLAYLDEAIEIYGSETAFIEGYNELKDGIITDLKNSIYITKYNTCDIPQVILPEGLKISKVPPFSGNFSGNKYISIDLVKANFQAINYFVPELLSASDYDTWLDTYTDIKYYHASKHLRQLIFVELNPTRTQRMISVLTSYLLNFLLDNGYTKIEDVHMVAADEIILKINEAMPDDLVNEIITKIKTQLQLDVTLKQYQLAVPHKNLLHKTYLNNTGYEVLCVPKHLYPQALKYVQKKDLTPYDFIFEQDKIIAQYLKPYYLT